MALSTVLGYYELSGEEHPNRQQTYFTGLQLEPADKSTEGLKAWLDFAKSENPTMVGCRSFEMDKSCFIIISHLSPKISLSSSSTCCKHCFPKNPLPSYV